MPAPKRVTGEEVVAAYRSTGSVWKAAKRIGVAGQSVWERLKLLGYRMPGAKWSEAESDELRALAGQCTIGDIAARLGRPYTSVATKLSRMGLAGGHYGNRVKHKIPRGAGFDKATTERRLGELERFGGALRQFCRMHGLSIEVFVQAVQRNFPDRWLSYTKGHTNLGERPCSYCGAIFFPLTNKQVNCTRACASRRRTDQSYFGGKRRNTIGLAEGVCQLCGKQKLRGLSSHHVLGKENDPDNDVLIALCMGCHKVVTLLASRTFVDDTRIWENLISLVIARRWADKAPEAAEVVTVGVEIDFGRFTKDGEEEAVPREVQLRMPVGPRRAAR
jgi:hypothetical protein